jgi:hypothetical protein
VIAIEAQMSSVGFSSRMIDGIILRLGLDNSIVEQNTQKNESLIEVNCRGKQSAQPNIDRVSLVK